MERHDGSVKTRTLKFENRELTAMYTVHGHVAPHGVLAPAPVLVTRRATRTLTVPRGSDLLLNKLLQNCKYSIMLNTHTEAQVRSSSAIRTVLPGSSVHRWPGNCMA